MTAHADIGIFGNPLTDLFDPPTPQAIAANASTSTRFPVEAGS